MNTLRAVTIFPRETYESKLKKMESFEIMRNESSVARIYETDRTAFISVLESNIGL